MALTVNTQLQLLKQIDHLLKSWRNGSLSDQMVRDAEDTVEKLLINIYSEEGLRAPPNNQ